MIDAVYPEDGADRTDCLIAELLFGHRWREDNSRDYEGNRYGNWVLFPPDFDRDVYRLPPRGQISARYFVRHYSTDLRYSEEVLDRMAARGFWCEERNHWVRPSRPVAGVVASVPEQMFKAGFTPHGTTGFNGRADHIGYGPSREMARCTAAIACLKAVLKDKQESCTHPTSEFGHCTVCSAPIKPETITEDDIPF